MTFKNPVSKNTQKVLIYNWTLNFEEDFWCWPNGNKSLLVHDPALNSTFVKGSNNFPLEESKTGGLMERFPGIVEFHVRAFPSEPSVDFCRPAWPEYGLTRGCHTATYWLALAFWASDTEVLSSTIPLYRSNVDNTLAGQYYLSLCLVDRACSVLEDNPLCILGTNLWR